MRKLRLEPDSLRVETFSVDPRHVSARGTVRARSEDSGATETTYELSVMRYTVDWPDTCKGPCTSQVDLTCVPSCGVDDCPVGPTGP